MHTLGLSLLELCLREAGWDSLWIGAPSPTEEVCHTILSQDVSMVAVSASQNIVDSEFLKGQSRLGNWKTSQFNLNMLL